MDKVSVIIPVFNKEPFIKACLTSVLNQTYPKLEVVVIDDGSTDRSYAIAASMRAADQRIMLIKGRHGGVSAARNTGLDRISGQLVVFVDADDELQPDYIEQLVQHADDDLVVSGLLAKELSPTAPVAEALRVPDGRIMASEIARQVFTKTRYPIFSLACTKLYRVELIQKHKIRFQHQAYGEDSLFVLAYLRYVRSIKLLAYAGYINRIVPQTVSRRHITNLWAQVSKVVQTAQANYPLGHGAGWQYLYTRAMKLGLENELGDYGRFRAFCQQLRAYPEISSLSWHGLQGDKSAQLVVLLLKGHLDPVLYLAYRLMIKGK